MEAFSRRGSKGYQTGCLATKGNIIIKLYAYILGAGLALCTAGLVLAPEPSGHPIKAIAAPAKPSNVELAVHFLNEWPEVTGIRVIDGNNIWVGATARPQGFRIALAIAAVKANIALGFGAHIYVTPSSHLARAPDAPIACSVTARRGKMISSDC